MDDILRKLQLTQVEILDVIDDLCRRNNIKYSLYAGTLLGAIRHKGFIPWDDDLDICMERKEYERFIDVWNNEKPKGYLLQNKKNTPAFTQSFSKIRKEHTTFLQFESERGAYHTGIFVDIFPIDRMADLGIQRVLFQWKSMEYQLMTREYAPPEAIGPVRWLSAAILLFTSKKKKSMILEEYPKYLKKFANPMLPRIATETMKTLRTPLPPDLMDNYTECLFENKNYPVFKEWDKYLRCKFGDYMTLPPEAERTWRHYPIILDFEHDLEELGKDNMENDGLIRVLQVTGIMNRGGTESMIMNLYRNMDRSRVQFDFVENSMEPAVYDDEIKKLGGRIYRCPHYNGKNHFSYIRWWKSFFNEHAAEYHIIHGHIGSTAAIYLSIAKKYGLFTIAHSHNTNGPISLKSVLYRLYSYSTRFMADFFFACSTQAGIDRFGERIAGKSDRYRVLNNAIDTEEFKYNPSVRSRIRKSFDLLDKDYIIGHVGRFVDQKNHAFIIDIFFELHRLNPNVKLLLVGDGPLQKAIEKKAVEMGVGKQVIMTGVRNDVADLLQGMDVLLFPSKNEGLPVTLVEAQTAGLPCVISDCIPKDTIITKGLVSCISLNKSPKKWARRVLAMKKVKRTDHSAEVREAGFDIWETAKWLEEFYLDKTKP